MKSFGKSGSYDPVEGEPLAGELLVELLQSDDGVNIGVDTGAVSEDSPVLQMRDAPLDRSPERGEADVELSVDVSESSSGRLLDRDDQFWCSFIAQIGNSPTGVGNQVRPPGVPETVHVMPATREGPAGADNAAV